MKPFTCTVDIELPRTRVIEFFDNPENMKHWQDGFVSYEHVSGNPGQVGAQTVIKYSMRGRTFDLLETVTKRSLPEELHGTYEGSWGKNSMKNYFEELGSHETRWRAELEYTEIKSVMMKLMSFIMPGMFKKQTQKWLDQFKAFAEEKVLNED